MEKIKLEQTVGGMQIKSIESTQRTGSGERYFVNGLDIFLELTHKIDLEKTVKNGGIHFQKNNNFDYESMGNHLIIGYWYKGEYYSDEGGMPGFIEGLQKCYNLDRCGWDI